MHHKNIKPLSKDKKVRVATAYDIDKAIKEVFAKIRDKKLGILLSGGMDSAILASYATGGYAYTFRFLGGELYKDELARAEYYAQYYGLELRYVDIDWRTVENYLLPVIKEKGAPVHSIEPQLYQAAIQAKNDGVEHLIVGESSDLIFGGMDQLLSKDWLYDEFVHRYIFTDPAEVLEQAVDISYLFERYRKGEKIDFLRFMDDVFSIESSSSYMNAFGAAGISYTDPYAGLEMAYPLDLQRVRSGESKYLIRELMRMKYPEIPVPNKVPMPRPVDMYFANWKGPKRPEFKKGLDMNKFTGNQKWQLYCLEEFLNLYEPL